MSDLERAAALVRAWGAPLPAFVLDDLARRIAALLAEEREAAAVVCQEAADCELGIATVRQEQGDAEGARAANRNSYLLAEAAGRIRGRGGG